MSVNISQAKLEIRKFIVECTDCSGLWTFQYHSDADRFAAEHLRKSCKEEINSVQN